MPFSDPDKKRTYAREYAKKHYERDKEKLRKRSREFWSRNREYARAKSASYNLWRAGKITRQQHEAVLRRPGGPPPARNGHGLTKADYDAMLERQAGVCAICGMVNATGVRLHVDHEHVEGYDQLSLPEKANHVRGLLCIPCNMLLGLSHDDPDVLEKRAAALLANVRNYLKR